jgi:dopamine D1-like receptor
VADLIVGFVVMPTATLHDMSNNVWFLGQVYCDIWHSMDVFASTASILSLLVIALDRYAAISDPIHYQNKWLTRNWSIYITGIWICSAFISFPAIAYWRLGTTKNAYSSSKNNGHLMYLCEFTDDVVYLVFSSLVSFYIPLPVMIFIYIRIYRTATRQMQFHLAGQKAFMKSSDGAESALRIHRGRYNSLMPNADADLAMVYVQAKPDALQQCSNCKQDQTNPNRMQLLAKLKPMKTLRKFSHDQKAATTLGILMGVFMCCWLPFFVYNVMTGIFKTESRAYLHAIFTWLGYINSGCE